MAPGLLHLGGVFRIRGVALAVVAAAVLPVASVPQVSAAESALKSRELPPKFRKSPYSLMSLSVGATNSGWQVRAKKLRNTPHLKVMRPANAYGHPALVLMLKRSSRDVARGSRGAKLLVGDLSKKDGGPLTGHISHQSGRDADVAFYVTKDGKSVRSPRFIAFTGKGKARDKSGYEFDVKRNWLLLQSWARDTRAGLSHVFVSSGLRRLLIAHGRKAGASKDTLTKALALLKQPPNSSAHDDHFHVRIKCPKKHEGLCRE